MGHIVIVSLGTQGLINPPLHLALRLLRLRLRVTFLTTVFAHRRILSNAATDLPPGLRLAAFSDGFDDGFTIHTDDPVHFFSQVKRAGTQTLSRILQTSALEGCPVTCLVNNLNLSWVLTVAREHQLPCAHLWVQSCTALAIYYHYFNGFGHVMDGNSCNDPSWSANLPGLPSLRGTDIPTFISSTGSAYNKSVLQTFKDVIGAIRADEKSVVLVNSFEELEPEAFKSVAMLNPIAIGPLISEASTGATSFRADLFRSTKLDYGAWLESKPESSVVYVSFGTLFAPPWPQLVEMARGLLASKRPFLWVDREIEKEFWDMGLDIEGMGNQGMIVPWVCQEEVLANPAVGCFVSHSGWNSVLESLAAGLPVVAIPQSSDQGTNAKLVAEEFGIGERGRKNQEGIVDEKEIRRCIDLVMSGQKRGEDIRKNCMKWKQLIKEATTKSVAKILREFDKGV